MVQMYNKIHSITMYISKKTGGEIASELIKKFTQSENILLKETALYAQ